MFSKLKRAIAPILSAAILVSALSPAMAASEGHTRADFSDVPPTHWAYDAVMYCADKGFVNGVGDNTFKPENTITVQEFVAVLVRLCLSEEDMAKYTAEVRADKEYVSAYEQSDWAYLPLMIAGQSMIYSINCGGYDLHYKEVDVSKWSWRLPITRIKAADCLFGSLKYSGEHSPDDFDFQAVFDCLQDSANISAEYNIDSISAVLAYGLMGGDDYKRFNPANMMTRAEACEVFRRLDDPAEREAVKTAMGVPSSYEPITIDMSNPGFHRVPKPGDTIIRPDKTTVVLARDPETGVLGFGMNVGPYLGARTAGGGTAKENTYGEASGTDQLAQGRYIKCNDLPGYEYTYLWSNEWKQVSMKTYPDRVGTEGEVDSTGLWKYDTRANGGYGNWIWQGPCFN